jgi:site-specific recombinase XerD
VSYTLLHRDSVGTFLEDEWAHVLKCVDAQFAGPENLRLKCILELLVTSGIRLEELANARHKDLRLESSLICPRLGS